MPQPIPTWRDFFPGFTHSDSVEPPDLSNAQLDMRCAWEGFGGKTLDEACAMMREHPSAYEEDFMWMGGPAFKFYFPAFDNYLRSLPVATEVDWTKAFLLAACIQTHFDYHEDMSGLHEQIISLCDYVCAHLTRFDSELELQEEIGARWADLRQQVADDARGIRRTRL